MTYLKCEWCDTNATRPHRLQGGRLSGVCLQHLQEMSPAERYDGDPRHRDDKTERLSRVEDLQRGDLVVVDVRTKDYVMAVSFVYTDDSLAAANSRTAVVHLRPGGYSVTLRNDNLAQYRVRRFR